MKESIINNVTAIMNKYSLEHNPKGIMANLEAWESNKRGLIDILRKHPNWSEDELAIVFKIDDSREINYHHLYVARDELLRLRNDIELSLSDERNLIDSIITIVGESSRKILNQNSAAEIMRMSGVNCVVGQKASRVIQAVCKKFGLDKHPEFSAKYARLADELNPLQIKSTATLSVNPCDYLEMSNRDNNWSSCHCLSGGGWRAGTLSYMNDGTSMIFSAFDEGATDNLHKYPKRTRQVFAYSEGALLQSRLYPYTNDEEARENYRNIVQNAFATCLEAPNLWTIITEHSKVSGFCHTHYNGLHYKDYTYSDYKPNISLLKEFDGAKHSVIEIGHTAYCVGCGKELRNSGHVTCGNCQAEQEERECCSHCGTYHDEDELHEIDGDLYCDDCCFWCDHCQEYCVGDYSTVRNRRGREITVCEHCRDNYYSYCENCEEYYLCEEVSVINGGDHDGESWCRGCLDEYMVTCHDCDEWVHNDDVVSIDGHYYCANCAESHNDESAQSA